MTSFDEFAVSARPNLLRFAAVLTNDRALGEDLVQDVMLRAHVNWHRIEGLDVPTAYVKKMLVNEFVSWRRKWGRLVPRSDVTSLLADRQVADFAPAHAEHAAIVQELAALPRRQRAVIVLRYLEDLSDRDIAQILDCTEATVRSQAARALRALRVERAAAATAANTPATARRS